MAGKIKAYITVPFFSTISPAAQESTINDVQETEALEHLELMRLFRESLYADADVGGLQPEITERAGLHEYNPRLDIFTSLLRHHLSYIDSEIPSTRVRKSHWITEGVPSHFVRL